ncbi:ammonium transporter [Periweissella beninensis]|uniref:ammonium transporter n=1 Tax=Periweissella beninensis TaxID=504936 RepID=UPI0021A6B43A|nr:ammonium transporter [Periweissella beninensis]MCT4395831.1 ammonium transporter [Periweissella beninensis]
MDTGDIVWVLISAALVWIMTPGLALFYGGLANKKYASNTVFLSVIILGIAPLVWSVLGYSLAFSGNGKFIGNLHNVLLNGISFSKSTMNLNIPDAAFMLFQGMFPIITVAIITGSVVGRVNLKAMLMFIPIWLITVYTPLAHMVWGGGLLAKLGALDFAGGDVVHISSGVSGLVLAILIGKRRKLKDENDEPDNIVNVVIGGALLWIGWFGFNSGSTLAANSTAILAFVNTSIAAASAMVMWFIIDFIRTNKAKITGALSGSLVGLVVITPAAGLVSPTAALSMALVATPIVYFLINFLKNKFHYDDTLDAFGFHGIGGIIGGILTGVFAFKENGGLIATGSLKQLGIQGVAVIFTIIFAGVMTFIIAKLISLVVPLRVEESVEIKGIDYELHGEYISILGSTQFNNRFHTGNK